MYPISPLALIKPHPCYLNIAGNQMEKGLTIWLVLSYSRRPLINFDALAIQGKWIGNKVRYEYIM